MPGATPLAALHETDAAIESFSPRTSTSKVLEREKREPSSEVDAAASASEVDAAAEAACAPLASSAMACRALAGIMLRTRRAASMMLKVARKRSFLEAKRAAAAMRATNATAATVADSSPVSGVLPEAGVAAVPAVSAPPASVVSELPPPLLVFLARTAVVLTDSPSAVFAGAEEVEPLTSVHPSGTLNETAWSASSMPTLLTPVTLTCTWLSASPSVDVVTSSVR